MTRLLYALITTVAINSAIDQSESAQTLEDFRFVSAIKKECDTYKVYYSQDFKIKSFTGNLYEIQKLGIDVNDVVEYYYELKL